LHNPKKRQRVISSQGASRQGETVRFSNAASYRNPSLCRAKKYRLAEAKAGLSS
jgi:hypothetical protein